MLIIGGYNYDNPALINLAGLNSLDSIGSDLYIEHNTSLISLDGLESLTSTGNIFITDNDLLNSLEGLESLNSIRGTLRLADNDDLIDLQGLNNLHSVDNIMIYNHDILTNLFGLNGLDSVEGTVNIANNAIVNFTGLESLNYIGGDLIIDGNDLLISLAGLENLTAIGGTLKVNDNNNLSSLTALNGLTSIGGDLWIRSNSSLTTLDGIENINAASIQGLYIGNQGSLCNCQMSNICEYLANPIGVVDIWFNGEGCYTALEVAEACGITLPCLPFGNYYFSTQAEVDSFPTNFPGCSDLGGNVLILGRYGYSSNICNLINLSTITSISGALYIFDNDLLTQLDGLENISASSISDLYIEFNSSLSDCEVQSICDYLVSPNGTVEVYANASGCNSQAEIEAACAVGISESAPIHNRMLLYPNPSHNQFTIEIKSDMVPGDLSILNLNGQILQNTHILNQITKIDIDNLPHGLYIAVFTSINFKEQSKLFRY
jgi:hypothetical protein